MSQKQNNRSTSPRIRMSPAHLHLPAQPATRSPKPMSPRISTPPCLQCRTSTSLCGSASTQQRSTGQQPSCLPMSRPPYHRSRVRCPIRCQARSIRAGNWTSRHKWWRTRSTDTLRRPLPTTLAKMPLPSECRHSTTCCG